MSTVETNDAKVVNSDVVKTEDNVDAVEESNMTIDQEAKDNDDVANMDMMAMEEQLKQRDNEIGELKKQLEEALKIGGDVANLTDSVKQLTTDLEANRKQVGQYEDVMKNVLESKMTNIPDQFKALIPENMSLIEKVAWLDKAESTGIFKTNTQTSPEIEIGKPMNVDVPKVDTSKLSGSQLLKMAFNTVKG